VPGDALDEATPARALAEDDEAFRELTDPHRRELQLHCYRLLGSRQDAEDQVQATLLTAWRSLERSRAELPCAHARRAGACAFAADGARMYPRAMRSAVSAAIDRRLKNLIVERARRQSPVLRLVPARWIRPAITPTAVRLRRWLSRGVLALALPTGIILARITVLP
jgi:hypothetical protein